MCLQIHVMFSLISVPSSASSMASSVPNNTWPWVTGQFLLRSDSFPGHGKSVTPPVLMGEHQQTNSQPIAHQRFEGLTSNHKQRIWLPLRLSVVPCYTSMNVSTLRLLWFYATWMVAYSTGVRTVHVPLTLPLLRQDPVAISHFSSFSCER